MAAGDSPENSKATSYSRLLTYGAELSVISSMMSACRLVKALVTRSWKNSATPYMQNMGTSIWTEILPQMNCVNRQVNTLRGFPSPVFSVV
jgi:hypothetical protein